MQVNIKKILSEKFITDEQDREIIYDAKLHKPSSFDLTLDKVISHDNNGTVKVHTEYEVEPQETVYLISKERIRVPEGYVAYVFLKNRLSQQGIIAFNTGLIDEGFKGPLSTLVTNLSMFNIEVPGDESDKFFRIVFHPIDREGIGEPAEIRSYSSEAYLKQRKKEIKFLPKHFLNRMELKRQISEEYSKQALSLGMRNISILLALLIILPIVTGVTINNLTSKKDNKMEEEIMELKERVKYLESDSLTK